MSRLKFDDGVKKDRHGIWFVWSRLGPICDSSAVLARSRLSTDVDGGSYTVEFFKDRKEN